MATIVVMTSPAKGHLYPVVETLLELRDRGHHIVVSTLSSEVPMLRNVGLEAYSLPLALDAAELNDSAARSAFAGMRAVVRQLFERIDLEYAHCRELIAAHRADAVISDLTTIGTQMAAEKSGLPWAIWSPTYLPLFSTDGPPPIFGLGKREGVVGAVRDTALSHTVRRVFDSLVLTRLNAVRAEYGLDRLKHVDEQFLRPPLTVNFLGEPIEKVHSDWPDSVKLVGPATWAPPAPVNQEIAAIDDPIVLVTCSTEVQNDGLLAQLTIDALAGTGVRTVVTTGAFNPAIFRPSANSTIMRFGPHAQILDKAIVAVIHGGMGITMKALSRGVPLVVAPFGRDQYETAKRVQDSGVGRQVEPHKITYQEMHAEIMMAMTFAGAAKKAAVSMDVKGSSVRAADHIEQLFAGQSSVRRIA